MGRDGMFWNIRDEGRSCGDRSWEKPQPSSTILLHLSSMASTGSGDLTIVIVILLAIIGLFAYSYLNKRRVANKQKELMKAFRASPQIAKDKPIFIQGQAQAPDLVLPTTGEHVAWYGLFVLSKETTIKDTRSGVGIRINGIPLGTQQTHIDAVEGFQFYESGGDFTVANGSAYYFVRPSGVMAYFQKGVDLIAGFVGGQFEKTGLPRSFFDDAMTVQVAQQALAMFCGLNAPIVEQRTHRHSGTWTTKTTTGRTTVSVTTASARIDARVHEFMAGYNIPPGIADLLAKRKIELPEKEQIIAIEVFIPLGREVFVFGTFDGDKSIVFGDTDVQLSVSYTDPSRE
jgi:hypothetical protein